MISLENKADTQPRIRTRRIIFFQMLDTVFRWCLMIISVFFFVIFLSRRNADMQIRGYKDRFSPVMSSNQLCSLARSLSRQESLS